VDSAIIRLTPLESPLVQPKDEAMFFAVVHAAFQQRRKTVLNALAGIAPDKETAAGVLQRAGILPSRRGETLTVEEFAAVADAFSTLK
jgi:16S rRNA (adenine1518-N6/adenine1519-N6)-dimethyltransferase